MQIPEDTFFCKTHEYIRKESDNIYLVGISEILANKIGNITYIGLPNPDYYEKKEVFAIAESSSVAAEIHMPLRANIIEVNSALYENPSLINTDPYGQGWILKVAPINYEEDKFDFAYWKDYLDDNK